MANPALHLEDDYKKEILSHSLHAQPIYAPTICEKIEKPESPKFSTSTDTTPSRSPTKLRKRPKYVSNSGGMSSRLKTIVKNLEYLWPPHSEDSKPSPKKGELKFLKKSLIRPASRMLRGNVALMYRCFKFPCRIFLAITLFFLSSNAACSTANGL